MTNLVENELPSIRKVFDLLRPPSSSRAGELRTQGGNFASRGDFRVASLISCASAIWTETLDRMIWAIVMKHPIQADVSHGTTRPNRRNL
eukprot:5177134-Prymnesium_polylepis.1